MEYDASYTIVGTRIEAVNSVTGTEQSGTYTPSAGTVRYVRLTWRTFGLENSVSFSGPVDFTDPEEANGAVWFRTADYSYADFNSLPSNQLQVYPVQCKQYVDEEWVELNCYIFKEGECSNGFHMVLYAGMIMNANQLLAVGQPILGKCRQMLVAQHQLKLMLLLKQTMDLRFLKLANGVQ